MEITAWNVTTLKNEYRFDILTDKIRRFELGLLGVLEPHIPRVRKKRIYLMGRKVFTQSRSVGCIYKEQGS